MKEIKYGIICEDEPQKLFIQHFILKQNSDSFKLVEDKEFDKQINFPSNYKNVLNNFTKLARFAFSQYRIDIVFLSIDSDSNDEIGIEKRKTQASELCKDFNENQYCICIPVQCIEYWYWYLKVKDEQKNYAKQLEKKNRDDAKKEIYNHKRYNKISDEPKLEELLQKFDVNYLKTNSISFNEFCSSFDNLKKSLVG